MASSCDTLRITEGRYLTENRENIDRTKYLKVKRTLCIIGGYDKKFEKITGYTTIDGDFNGNDRYDDEGKVIGGNEENCLCTYTVPRFCISKMLRYAMPSSMIIP